MGVGATAVGVERVAKSTTGTVGGAASHPASKRASRTAEESSVRKPEVRMGDGGHHSVSAPRQRSQEHEQVKSASPKAWHTSDGAAIMPWLA